MWLDNDIPNGWYGDGYAACKCGWSGLMLNVNTGRFHGVMITCNQYSDITNNASINFLHNSKTQNVSIPIKQRRDATPALIFIQRNHQPKQVLPSNRQNQPRNRYPLLVLVALETNARLSSDSNFRRVPCIVDTETPTTLSQEPNINLRPYTH